MKVALSSDHRGTAAIRAVCELVKRLGHDAELFGDCAGAACDYPERAFQVAQAVASGKFDVGVLICGTGIGMSIAANKVKGVRAAVVHDEMTAQLSRSHNNANVLCMSGDLLGARLIEKIVETWLRTEFEGGRHARRIHKISAIEEGREPSTVTE
ncbi:MAG: ribose 5-phosphate isomerase B [Planctomycetota bacterium]|nr:ribose 5-phosphate isomerase B [Planctomycetota bacterium]